MGDSRKIRKTFRFCVTGMHALHAHSTNYLDHTLTVYNFQFKTSFGSPRPLAPPNIPRYIAFIALEVFFRKMQCSVNSVRHMRLNRLNQCSLSVLTLCTTKRANATLNCITFLWNKLLYLNIVTIMVLCVRGTYQALLNDRRAQIVGYRNTKFSIWSNLITGARCTARALREARRGTWGDATRLHPARAPENYVTIPPPRFSPF